MPFVQGPFLYLYTSTLTNQNRDKKYNLLHFTPFVIAIIYISFLINVTVFQMNRSISFKIALTIV